MRTLALAALLFAVSGGAAIAADAAPDHFWPAGAKINIVSPKSGAKVKSPVTIVFGHKGVELAPAGDKTPNSGHFHLLIYRPDREVQIHHQIAADRQLKPFSQFSLKSGLRCFHGIIPNG